MKCPTCKAEDSLRIEVPATQYWTFEMEGDEVQITKYQEESEPDTSDHSEAFISCFDCGEEFTLDDLRKRESQ